MSSLCTLAILWDMFFILHIFRTWSLHFPHSHRDLQFFFVTFVKYYWSHRYLFPNQKSSPRISMTPGEKYGRLYNDRVALESGASGKGQSLLP